MSNSSSTITSTNVANAIGKSAGKGQSGEGMSLESFLASLAVAAAVFGVEVLIFVLLRTKLQRVYVPRTYLVPEKRRTKAPGSGILSWFKPIFATANSDFINKSGLDAYFFLRYLLMLLKCFCILAVVILPILLPLNSLGGRGAPKVRGMDQLAWTNIASEDTHRYWAHLLLAVGVVVVFCYMFYHELRAYIRLRQAYLTSPQHRLRASATTVLVSSIPRKWLTVEALVGLYDVFPGGIRNVWINRDYEELQEKVEERGELAKRLEAAETELISMAKKRQMKELRKKANTSAEKAQITDAAAAGEEIANGPGLSSGNPHQIPQDLHDHTHDKELGRSESRFPKVNPIKAVDDGFHKLGHGVMGGVSTITGGVRRLRGEVEDYMPSAAYGYQAGDDEPPAASKQPLRQTRETSETREPETRQDETRRRRGSTLAGHDAVSRENSYGSPQRTRTQPTIDTSITGVANPHPMGGQQAAVDAPPKWMYWKRRPKVKRPKVSDGHKKGDDDETPFNCRSPTTPHPSHSMDLPAEGPSKEYPKAFNEEYADDNDGDPLWKKYLSQKDRPTMNLPLFGVKWLPSLPLIGKKVDTIYYCRKELARLNVEIEQDQSAPEKYPLMNSAFVQFNQQVAAHMACQSLSHHVPQHMCPRHIEVSPDDVIWSNMKISWWQRYLRIVGITVATGGLIIGWAFPVAVVGLVSQIDYLTQTIPWLKWVDKLPNSVLGLIQGVLPPLGLAILMALLPIILRAFARLQGNHTGMAIERAVQGMYFAFLFIQIFLVVSISSGITTVFQKLADNIASAPSILAQNLPKASNFFFSYLLLQAFTVSGGAILQIGTLFVQFILSPILDSTARQKFTRATELVQMKWGTFFPVYTNLACIGIIYSIISPLILVFNICTFSLFWMVYRYNLLYVHNFRFDTGGLLFPRAINQLFTGIYVMEICLIGLFFLVRDVQGRVACFPQAIIMIVVTIFTVLYQYTLNSAFGPLLTYLPITLEDDAVLRDEAFARDNENRRLLASGNIVPEEQEGDDLNEVLAEREKRERRVEHVEEIEMRNIQNVRGKKKEGIPSLFSRGRSHNEKPDAGNPDHYSADPEMQSRRPPPKKQPHTRPELMLFENIADEIEDLSPKERDILVGRAFQHEALRAKRPVIWIPRDDLGISDDEIRRTQRFSDNVWISNEYTGLDRKGRVVYRRPPPDFDQRDLVEL
ncbi:DUF221-domain-containing protein [Choiromyces venosus 120613-1]|uniref:DUF221-domain-containing protein n=1 Tax=Choiromyces venosus 120613-1 TaxID=1336337 RepID=A0A3N4JR45_9PEZI|nr:DUF221-domain-containing protein [Choiromyces venosus 120613-1]